MKTKTKFQKDYVDEDDNVFSKFCNRQSKLKESDVRLVRELITSGLSNVEISKRTGVRRRTVSDIKNKKSWAWLK